MSSDQVAISVRGLGKSYRIEHKTEHTSAAEALLHRIRNPFKKPEVEEIWAMRDVSFDIARGDIVGLIGRNGAGKSTLLKMLSRITEPTTGEIRIAGRVASLIEVGTGFQPELTGRENIYLNGSILGMRRAEITRRFDEIVDFSGVEKFLDTPVKRYSSGMYVRLAFAVAAHLDTDILLVDEVLSVGDAEFQKKSLGKMNEVANSGRTVLFVGHNVAALESLCRRGIYFEKGQIVKSGTITECLTEYQKSATNAVFGGEGGPSAIDLSKTHRYFKSYDLVDETGASTRILPLASDLRVKARVKFTERFSSPTFIVSIETPLGQRVLSVKSPKTEGAIMDVSGEAEIDCVIERLPAAPGDYLLRVALAKYDAFVEDTGFVLPFTVTDADAFADGWGAHRGLCVAKSHWRVTDAAVELQVAV